MHAICPKIGLAAAVAVLIMLPASAQDIGALRDMDANGDGTITKAEAQAFLEARFKAMDTNHDGKLSEDEFVNAGLKRLSALDKDGDGQVTRSELRSELRSRFGR